MSRLIVGCTFCQYMFYSKQFVAFWESFQSITYEWIKQVCPVHNLLYMKWIQTKRHVRDMQSTVKGWINSILQLIHWQMIYIHLSDPDSVNQLGIMSSINWITRTPTLHFSSRTRISPAQQHLNAKLISVTSSSRYITWWRGRYNIFNNSHKNK